MHPRAKLKIMLKSMDKNKKPYSGAFAVAIMQQIPITFLFSIVYDGGQLFQLWLCSLIPYYAIFLLMKQRCGTITPNIRA
jgi:hypothetical protein